MKLDINVQITPLNVWYNLEGVIQVNDSIVLWSDILQTIDEKIRQLHNMSKGVPEQYTDIMQELNSQISHLTLVKQIIEKLKLPLEK